MTKHETSLITKIGSWAFIFGVVIALIAGIFGNIMQSPIITSVLIILGLIVGFLNVSGKETTPFLLATAVLAIIANFGGDVLSRVAVIGPTLQGTLSAMMVFIVPATIIVALKAIYALAHDD